MTEKGGDGAWIEPPPEMPTGPEIEMPLAAGMPMGAIAPTMVVMTNLPAIMSLASSLVKFVIDLNQETDLHMWMYRSVCEKHRAELPSVDVSAALRAYKVVIDNYLDSLGMVDGCSHDEKENENDQ